jgi:hypothetical protein
MTTCAPELTSALAMAKPIPELPPITTAFFSFNGILHLHVIQTADINRKRADIYPTV